MFLRAEYLIFIAMLTLLTACNYRQDSIEGVVRFSTDLVEYEVRTTVDDDNCWTLADDEIGIGWIGCEDWLGLQTPVPGRLEEKNQMEIGKTYELATLAYLNHREDNPSEVFSGIDPQELDEVCELSRAPTGTIRRVDESQWKQASSGWSGVFDLEFEHGCISGALRFYRNIKLDRE